MFLIKSYSFWLNVCVTRNLVVLFCLLVTFIASGETIFSASFEDADVSQFTSCSSTGWLKVNVVAENGNHFVRLKSDTPKKHIDLRLANLLPIKQPEAKSVNISYRIRKQGIDSPWWMFWRKDPDVLIAYYWMDARREDVDLKIPPRTITALKNDWTPVSTDFEIQPNMVFFRMCIDIKDYHSGTLDLDDLVVSWK